LGILKPENVNGQAGGNARQFCDHTAGLQARLWILSRPAGRENGSEKEFPESFQDNKDFLHPTEGIKYKVARFLCTLSWFLSPQSPLLIEILLRGLYIENEGRRLGDAVGCTAEVV